MFTSTISYNHTCFFLEKQLNISIGIDGLSLFKSKSFEVWPILCRVVNCMDKTPFVVSVHASQSKPKSVEDFLRPFLDEMKILSTYGVTFNGVVYKVNLIYFVCDAPARQFLKCIKGNRRNGIEMCFYKNIIFSGHAGYYACEKCTQKGFYDRDYKCMTYPELEDLTLRTNLTFRSFRQKNHHKGHSPLLELDLCMISSFPLDYMHLVLLG